MPLWSGFGNLPEGRGSEDQNDYYYNNQLLVSCCMLLLTVGLQQSRASIE